MKKINDDISEWHKRAEQNELVLARIQLIKEELSKLAIKEKALHSRTEVKLKIIEELEKKGISQMIKSVLIKNDENLELTKKEYLEVIKAHKEISHEIDVLKFELKVLEGKRLKPEFIRKQIDELVRKKKFLLNDSDTNFSSSLFQKESELGRYKNLSQKYENCCTKASVLNKVIVELYRELSKVKAWPAEVRAGDYSSYKKKKYLQQAKAKSAVAKARIRELNEVVAKLHLDVKVDHGMNNYDAFIGEFYDYLITDSIIQGMITSSLNDLKQIRINTEEIMTITTQHKEEYDNKVSTFESELTLYIINYK